MTNVGRVNVAVARLSRASKVDRIALTAIGLGLALYVLPWWPTGALKVGFWFTFVGTLLHIYSSAAVASAQRSLKASEEQP